MRFNEINLKAAQSIHTDIFFSSFFYVLLTYEYMYF